VKERCRERDPGLSALCVVAAAALVLGCDEDGGPIHNLDTIRPGQVTDLHIAQQGDSSFVLTWTAPGDDGDDGQAAAYDIRHSLSPATMPSWWDSVAVPLSDVPTPRASGTAESLLLRLDSPDSSHFVALKALDEAGNQSPMSNVASYPPPSPVDTIPPASVQDLHARAMSSQSVLLVWTAPGENGSECRAASYDIRYSVTVDSLKDAWDLVVARLGQGLTPRTAGSRESLLVESLLPGTEYHFALKASDRESNWSAQSNIARGITLPLAGRFLYVTPDGLGEFATIQEAIDAATEGDVVELGDGMFTGQGNRALRYRGKPITVRSRSGAAPNCIIDCQGAGRGFEFLYDEDSLSVLDGVTVRGGVASRGGAIVFFGTGTGPFVSNCIFEHNSATDGGAVYACSPGVTIESCVFRTNTAAAAGALSICSRTQVHRCTFEGNEASSGGAILCLAAQVDLLDCTFIANSTGSMSEPACGGAVACWYSALRVQRCDFFANQTRGYGGALFLSDSSQVTLSECNLHANSALQGGGAVALSIFESSGGHLLAEECMFLGNESDGPGGAIHCFGSSPRFTCCTMALNRATQGGGTVFCQSGSSPLLGNCILAFNESGGTVICEDAACKPVLACSDVFGNSGGDWVGCLDGLSGLNGNISLDPRFCDLANGDIRLMSNSPCTAMNSPCGSMGASGETCPSGEFYVEQR